MKKICLEIFLILGVFAFLVFMPGCNSRGKAVEVEQKDTIQPPMGFWPDSLDMFEGTIRSGETFTDFMGRLGMEFGDIMALVDSCDTVFDVRKLRAGNRFRAYYYIDSTAVDSTAVQPLEYVVYDQDKVNMTIFKCTAPVKVWKFSKPVEHQTIAADVTISSSLWNDMVKAGVSPLLIVSLSDIYAWSVDFFSLQEGDEFKVLYTQEVCDSEITSIDSIYFAEFIRDSTVLPAIHFDRHDGTDTYWGRDGKSLKKAFLKAPLKFTRISSGFSYHRRHPVTGKVRPHTAVDYAAPTGTPVMTIGDGTVVSAGWSRGGGNTVRIRHNSTYETAYLHLSRYGKGIKAGAKVRQGDVIGYVGSTGVSTGPHLDFRVWKNGTPINPLTMQSPPSDPLPEQYIPALDSLYEHYSHVYDSLRTK